MTLDDARLGELPANWQKIAHENQEYHNLFESTVTGEVSRYDPRLSVEALEAAGHVFETFALV